MRLFLAIPLPLDLARAASSALPAHRGLRPVSPELMHMTLAFLGATDRGRFEDVSAAAQLAAREVVRFTATLEGVGRFPERGDPRVVWLGIGRGAESLVALAESARRALVAHRVAFDDKPFRAHITLARVRDGLERDELRAISRAVDAIKPPSGAFEVDALVVFESVVSSKGPRYTVRATWPLASSDRT